jgi:hypothetical protein
VLLAAAAVRLVWGYLPGNRDPDRRPG